MSRQTSFYCGARLMSEGSEEAIGESMAAVVLAGGFGTRLRQVLSDRPKPMALVDGKPFVEWVLRYLRSQGLSQFVLSTGFMSEMIADHFQSVTDLDDVMCVHEAEPLGTAGGFLNCVASVARRPDWWLVCNGDSIAAAPLDPLFSLRRPGVDGAILGVAMSDASRYGTLDAASDGILRGFAEKRPGDGVINAGVYMLSQVLARTYR